MDEASQRLQIWIKRQGGERLVTAHGAAEESNSPLTPEQDDDQLEQQQAQVGSLRADPWMGAAAANYTGGDEAEHVMHRTNLGHLHLHQPRSLSGSTLASSSTLPTAFGNSTLPSKRQSSGKPRDAPAMPSDVGFDGPVSEVEIPRVSNPSETRTMGPATTMRASLFDENAPTQHVPSGLLKGQAAQRNPSSKHAIPSSTRQPAEASVKASRNMGGLKRTISTLTFDDLTPSTRTAFPPSEATDVPPAYARPRSEVGLPPLLPGEKDEADTDEVEEDQSDAAGTSLSSGLFRGRPLSSQYYLPRPRMESRESRASA